MDDGLVSKFQHVYCLSCTVFISLFWQAGGNADDLQEKSKDVKKKIAETEEREQAVIKKRDSLLASMGNLVHDSVPISQDEVRETLP